MASHVLSSMDFTRYLPEIGGYFSVPRCVSRDAVVLHNPGLTMSVHGRNRFSLWAVIGFFSVTAAIRTSAQLAQFLRNLLVLASDDLTRRTYYTSVWSCDGDRLTRAHYDLSDVMAQALISGLHSIRGSLVVACHARFRTALNVHLSNTFTAYSRI